jgi:protoporphyrin/coproporphyrin ferrochelatase
MSFAKEPSYQHGSTPQVGVLLCNLGTPDAPTPKALRRYLAEFLSDSRVVEIPKPIWWLILHGIILRLRPAKSAKKYESIWLPEGSPLKVWSDKQALMLRGYLGQQGMNAHVVCAMRYGNPSMASGLDALKAQGCTRILVLPLYPQYAAATTASVVDAVNAWTARQRNLPELRFVRNYHDEPLYIAALAARVREHWQTHGRGSQLVMSFHGVPERSLHLGDPYHCECYKTARLLAEALGLTREQYQVTFQSRFGKAKWLGPYTEPTLVALAQKGTQRVDVMCPGFTSDCLETLEEINQEAREAFLHAGGQQFEYIPCLNDQHPWLQALTHIAKQHMQGWFKPALTDAAELAAQRQAALAMGAKQ